MAVYRNDQYDCEVDIELKDNNVYFNKRDVFCAFGYHHSKNAGGRIEGERRLELGGSMYIDRNSLQTLKNKVYGRQITQAKRKRIRDITKWLSKQEEQLAQDNTPEIANIPAVTAMLSLFEGNKVRSAMIDGEAYVVAVDVATVLGYKDPGDAVRNHVPKGAVVRHPLNTNGGIQTVNMINISGITRLISGASTQSNSPEIRERAERFNSWIHDEVIPSLMHNGYYVGDKEKTRKDLSVIPQEAKFSTSEAMALATAQDTSTELYRIMVDRATEEYKKGLREGLKIALESLK